MSQRPKWWVDAALVVIAKAKRKLKLKDDVATDIEPTDRGIQALRDRLYVAGGEGEFFLLNEDCRKLLEWERDDRLH